MCTDKLASSWWLQMSWRQIGARPSVAIMMIQRWLMSQYTSYSNTRGCRKVETPLLSLLQVGLFSITCILYVSDLSFSFPDHASPASQLRLRHHGLPGQHRSTGLSSRPSPDRQRPLPQRDRMARGHPEDTTIATSAAAVRRGPRERLWGQPSVWSTLRQHDLYDWGPRGRPACGQPGPCSIPSFADPASPTAATTTPS